MIRKHVTVHGTVQGVFYRASASQAASDLGVAGWVRNTGGGSVELVAEGDDDAVERMIAWARSGPTQAHVTSVDVRDEPPEGLTEFTQV